MKDNYVRDASLIRIIDGDSFLLQVNLAFGVSMRQYVRLSGVNCPESRGPESIAGKYVTKQVEAWIEEKATCVLRSVKWTSGKFGRCVGELWFDSESLNEYLTTQRLGWTTDKRGKLLEPRNVGALNLPEGIKQHCSQLLP